MKLKIHIIISLLLFCSSAFSQKIAINPSMLSYYQNQGNQWISLSTLVDEQNKITTSLTNNSTSPKMESIYMPSWGTVPKIQIDLGASFTINQIAIWDSWNEVPMTIKYDKNGTWTLLETWGMSYSEKWKTFMLNVTTSKLLFEFEGINGQIGEVAVFGSPGVVDCTHAKLSLSSSMVKKENGGGDAGLLVNEQALSGDPANGTGGAPSEYWFPGWSAEDANVSAYIDLGNLKEISAIYLRDVQSNGAFTVSSGSPGNWEILFTDNLTGWQSWNGHEVKVTTRYLRFTRQTLGANVAEVIIYGCDANTVIDNTAPAAVTNLNTGTISSSSIQLTWTAPGDDGNTGTAKAYDIRYSTAVITAANFNDAIKVAGPPVPAVAGSSQSHAVTGLVANTTYYFALKTTDEVPNSSAISNVVSAKTQAAGTCTSAKLVLTPSMIVDEEGYGKSGLLVDEQALAGDPATTNGGGAPVTVWDPGWNKYPANVYFDLGSPKKLSSIHLKDVPGGDGMIVSTGYPGHWTTLFTESLGHWDAWKNHNVDVVTRFVRLTRLGNGSNIAEIVMYGCSTPDADVTPPAAITTLKAGTTTKNSVQISWSAPGDDGNSGTASSYEIRQSYQPITEANFSAAHIVPNAPKPTAAGTTQSVTINELISSTTYYIAIKTYDEFGNAGPISSVTAKTVSIVVPQMFTMEQFIGANAFVDDPIDKMQAVGFIREYHEWTWDEGGIWKDRNGVLHGDVNYGSYYPNNKIMWAPSTGGGAEPWNFDVFYSNVKKAGLGISPVAKGAVAWLHGGTDYNNDHKAIDEPGASTLDPNSYEKKAHHMYQYAARYGSTKVDDSKLTLAANQPRNSGMGLIKYIEDWNEPNKWWDASGKSNYTPEEYAAMSSANYDGHMNTMKQGSGTFGVKNADPTIKMVMGGLAESDLDYIRRIKAWYDKNRNGSFAADVINVHHYAFKNGVDDSEGGPAVSPEADNFKERLLEVVNYRNTYLPGKEVWISEFGWDTQPQSPLAPPVIGNNDLQETQGQWLVRAYLAFAAAGVDRAQMYMLRDPTNNPEGFWQKFSTSGLVTVRDEWTPKKSWYYIYTMKNTLTNMKFLGEETSTDPNILIYKFKNVTTNEGAYAVWAKTSSDYKKPGYILSLKGTPSTATLIKLENGQINGISSPLTITSGKVTVDVSERPIFIKVNNIQ